MDVSPHTPFIIGVVASVFTGLSLLPQLITILQKRKADDVSMGMLAVLFIGLSLWISYGVLKKDIIIIVANSFSWLVNIIIVFLTIKYKKKRRTR